MNELDTTVRESLDERAQGYAVPPAPGALILARARREHRRRQVLITAAGVAAAAAIALAVGPNLGDSSAQRVPGGPSSVMDPEPQRSAGRAGYEWARSLPQGPDVDVTAWPSVRTSGGRVVVVLPRGNVSLPAQVAGLASPQLLPDGWVFVGLTRSVGDPQQLDPTMIVRVSRLTMRASIMASNQLVRDLMPDNGAARLAWVGKAAADAADQLTIVDLASGVSSSWPFPVDQGRLTTWTDDRLLVVPAVSPAGSPALGAVIDVRNGSVRAFQPPGRVLDVRPLHSYRGSSTTALLQVKRDSQECVMRLVDDGQLDDLRCVPSPDSSPVLGMSVSPGGRWVMVGALGPGSGDSQPPSRIFDTTTLADAPGLPAAIAQIRPGDVRWESDDVLLSSGASESENLVQGFRLDVRSGEGQRLSEDARPDASQRQGLLAVPVG